MQFYSQNLKLHKKARKQILKREEPCPTLSLQHHHATLCCQQQSQDGPPDSSFGAYATTLRRSDWVARRSLTSCHPLFGAAKDVKVQNKKRVRVNLNTLSMQFRVEDKETITLGI
jgi:hypothetical protein